MWIMLLGVVILISQKNRAQGLCMTFLIIFDMWQLALN